MLLFNVGVEVKVLVNQTNEWVVFEEEVLAELQVMELIVVIATTATFTGAI